MSFTAKQVEEAVKKQSFYTSENSFWTNFHYDSEGREELRQNLGADKVDVVVQYGGEGDGAPISIVFTVDDEFFEKNGTYSSWDSDYWDATLVKVTPYQEMVTKYKPVIE